MDEPDQLLADQEHALTAGLAAKHVPNSPLEQMNGIFKRDELIAFWMSEEGKRTCHTTCDLQRAVKGLTADSDSNHRCKQRAGNLDLRRRRQFRFVHEERLAISMADRPDDAFLPRMADRLEDDLKQAELAKLQFRQG